MNTVSTNRFDTTGSKVATRGTPAHAAIRSVSRETTRPNLTLKFHVKHQYALGTTVCST